MKNPMQKDFMYLFPELMTKAVLTSLFECTEPPNLYKEVSLLVISTYFRYDTHAKKIILKINEEVEVEGPFGNIIY